MKRGRDEAAASAAVRGVVQSPLAPPLKGGDAGAPALAVVAEKSAVVAGTLAAIAAMSWTLAAQACPVCFGDPASKMTQGAAQGVLFMAALTYALLLGMVGITVAWAVRARRMARGAALAGDSVTGRDAMVDAAEGRAAGGRGPDA